jgi:hypothetical protein
MASRSKIRSEFDYAIFVHCGSSTSTLNIVFNIRQLFEYVVREKPKMEIKNAC